MRVNDHAPRRDTQYYLPSCLVCHTPDPQARTWLDILCPDCHAPLAGQYIALVRLFGGTPEERAGARTGSYRIIWRPDGLVDIEHLGGFILRMRWRPVYRFTARQFAELVSRYQQAQVAGWPQPRLPRGRQGHQLREIEQLETQLRRQIARETAEREGWEWDE